MSEPVAKHRPMIDLDEFERRLRRPASPQGGDEDPLAELARLVAGNADPYQNVFADPPAAERVSDPASDRGQALAHDHGQEHVYDQELPPIEPQWGYGEPAATELRQRPAIDFAAIEAGLLRGSVQPELYGEVAPEPQPAAFHAARYPEPPVEWREAATEAPRSRKPLYMMAAVIVLGVAGIGASFAYKGRVAGARQIATIMAAPGPVKVQPQTDADAPAQSASVLDKSASPATVALADHREEPVDVTQIKTQPADPTGGLLPGPATASAPAAALPDTRVIGNAPVQAQSRPPAAPAPNPQLQQPVGIAALIEPKKVKTVSVRPDGTLLPNDTPPQAVGQAASQAATLAAPPSPRPAPVAKPATPKTTHAATTPRAPAPAAEQVEANAPLALTPVKARPVAARPVHVADATPTAAEPTEAADGAGAFAVQLAAPGSEKEARETTSRLEHAFASQLDGHQPSIRKAKVGDKDVYRVRVGGLSRDEAAAMCEKIKSGGGKCFIARN